MLTDRVRSESFFIYNYDIILSNSNLTPLVTYCTAKGHPLAHFFENSIFFSIPYIDTYMFVFGPQRLLIYWTILEVSTYFTFLYFYL